MLLQKPNPTKQPIAHKDATWVMWAERVIATLGHTTLPLSQTRKFHWFALIWDLRQPSRRFQGTIYEYFSYTGVYIACKKKKKMFENRRAAASFNNRPLISIYCLIATIDKQLLFEPQRHKINISFFFLFSYLLLAEMEGVGGGGWVNKASRWWWRHKQKSVWG